MRLYHLIITSLKYFGNCTGGTWAAIAQGRCLVGVNTSDNDFKTPEKTGGEKKHTLTVAEMPSHSHTIGTKNLWMQSPTYGNINPGATEGANQADIEPNQTNVRGNNEPHNNLQPYLCVYIFKRTA